MVYVGMTRVKNNPSVHFDCGNIFTDAVSRGSVVSDNSVYGAPEEVLVLLSHRDVVLDMFKSNQNLLHGLHSGTVLEVDGDFLSVNVGGHRKKILKFSALFRKRLQKNGIQRLCPG